MDQHDACCSLACDPFPSECFLRRRLRPFHCLSVRYQPPGQLTAVEMTLVCHGHRQSTIDNRQSTCALPATLSSRISKVVNDLSWSASAPNEANTSQSGWCHGDQHRGGKSLPACLPFHRSGWGLLKRSKIKVQPICSGLFKADQFCCRASSLDCKQGSHAKKKSLPAVHSQKEDDDSTIVSV